MTTQTVKKKVSFLISQCLERTADSFLEERICLTRAENNGFEKRSESLQVRTKGCSNSCGSAGKIFMWRLTSGCNNNKGDKACLWGRKHPLQSVEPACHVRMGCPGKKKDLKLNGVETLSEFCNNRVVPMPAVQTSGCDAWPFGDTGNVSVPKIRIPLHARGRNISVDNTWLLQQHFPVTQATKQFAILQK